MSRNLYQVLDIGNDASPEQVRKAYKKKALQTHPDRLPVGATAEDKASAEEQFRMVNNAYEVLIDPQNRKLYDTHGVWPPPDLRDDSRNAGDRRHYPNHHHRHHHHHHHHHQQPFGGGFFDPFESHPFDHPQHMPFAFTDPFQLFNSIFGDPHRFEMFPSPHSGPFDSHHHFFHPESGRWGHGHGLIGDLFNAMRQPSIGGGTMHMQSEAVNVTGDGTWTQEMRMTTVVNGVTQEIWKRRDSHGNEHVTCRYPDGRETYHVNGVEQSPSRARHDRYIGGPRHDYTSPPPPQITYNTPPPPYTPNRSMHQQGDLFRRNYRHNHQQDPENGFPVIPRTSQTRAGTPGPGPNSKRKWWHTGW